MKLKDYCQRCGHYHQANSLKKEISGKRMLCNNCYKFNNNERLNRKIEYLPLIEGFIKKSIKKERSTIRRTKNSKKDKVLTRDETVFIQKKYGYDSFKEKGKPCSQISRLREALWIGRKNEKIKEKEELDIEKKNKKMNFNFLKGLPQ